MATKYTDEDLKGFLETAVELARSSGEIMREAFYKEKTVDRKQNHADLVTETDGLIEHKVKGVITETYPDHRFIGEESAVDGKPCEFTDHPTWIVDPIDGTTNFIHGIEEFAFSLGVTINKEPVVGVIYLPIPDKLYSARKGNGAYCNGKKISVSGIKDIKEALIMSEGGNDREDALIRNQANNVKAIITNSRGLRAFGSTAVDLCMLAAGKVEAYVQYDIHCWDMAAGVVIASEAGATIQDPTGAEVDLMSRRVMVTCSESLAKQLSPLLSHIAFGRD